MDMSLPEPMIRAAAWRAEWQACLVGTYLRLIGVSSSKEQPARFPATVLLELAALLQLGIWGQQGLCQHIDAEIPLHPDLVTRLRDYFKRTQPAPGHPIFPLRTPGGSLRATAKMMKHDCESAGLKYSTTDGFFDFHSNRVLFITSLCRSNVNLIMAQKLARHSAPKLTSNIYSKVSTQERAEAINEISLEGQPESRMVI